MGYFSSIKDYIIVGSVISALFLLVSELWQRIARERVSWFHRLMMFFLGLYLTALFSLTVSPVYSWSVEYLGKNINLMPFQVLSTAGENPLNFIGNILLFVPLGVLLVLLSTKFQRLLKVLLAGAGLSLAIELLQLFSIRATDIDDVILNTAGTLFGFLIGRTILALAPPLRGKIGILKKAGGRSFKKINDAGGFVLLSLCVVSFILFNSFLKQGGNAQIPQGAVQNRSPSAAPIAAFRISAEIEAGNACVLNEKTNEILYGKNDTERIAPASTAKLLTALSALDSCTLDEVVIVGPEIQCISDDSSRAWLNVGDELTVRQLLTALLLPSGNDAAYVLAVHVGRKTAGSTLPIDQSVKRFVEVMNKKAQELGALSSCFASPDGYDTDGQFTTARDLAVIAKACLGNEPLSKILGSYRISEKWPSGQEVTYYNTNELINPNSPYYYEDAIGMKTGSSGAAGECLVSAAKINGTVYICVVMGGSKEGRWADSLSLYSLLQQ